MTGLSLVTGPVYAITPVKVSQQTRLCSEKPKSVKFRVKYELLVQILAEISVSPGDRQKSPASRPWRASYSDPNKKINILEVGELHCVTFLLPVR